MKKHKELIALIEKFTNGDDRSMALANELELAIDHAFPDDEVMQETVLMLASYRPEGGEYLYSEEAMQNQLQKAKKRVMHVATQKDSSLNL